MQARAFHRSRALITALAAAVMSFGASTPGSAASVALSQARDAAATYKSRGHGGKRAHRPTGIAGVQRAARKARNVKANRRAQR